MNRRGFIGSLAAIAAAPLVPARLLVAVLPAIPILYGDGLHDDAHALELALNGGAVNWSDGNPVGDRIEGKRLYCSRTVNIRELRRCLIGNILSDKPIPARARP